MLPVITGTRYRTSLPRTGCVGDLLATATTALRALPRQRALYAQSGRSPEAAVCQILFSWCIVFEYSVSRSSIVRILVLLRVLHY